MRVEVEISQKNFLTMLAFHIISGLPRNKVCIVMEALLWHIFIQGLLQPSLTLLVSLVICPLASLVVFLGEYLFLYFSL